MFDKTPLPYTPGPGFPTSLPRSALASRFCGQEDATLASGSRLRYDFGMATSTSQADILVLSSAIGSGHMRASAALALGVGLVEPDRTCSIVDFPHEVSPAVEDLIRRTYLESLKLMPDLYGKLYRMSEARATQQSTPSRTSELYERWQQFSEQWAATYDPQHQEGGSPVARPQ